MCFLDFGNSKFGRKVVSFLIRTLALVVFYYFVEFVKNIVRILLYFGSRVIVNR